MRSLGRRSLVLSVVIGLLGGTLPARVAAAAPTLSAHTIASGLQYPWDVAFVPDGTMLVTERPGRIRVYSSGATDATLLDTITVPSVRAVGEAGLMGIAVDTDFASNGYVYVCASRLVSNAWRNQVLRYRIAANGSWANPTVLNIGTMLAANIHDGCALEMDKHGKLWIGMGDASNEDLAQDRNSLNGKVLRVNRDGSIPSDNPVFGGKRDRVYSMGHRNPQGIAFQPGTDRVYVIEHGPEKDDEINLLAPGGNYGWPCYTGAGHAYYTSGCGPASSYRNPVWASGTPTIATSGGTFVSGSQWGDYNGQLFVSTLKWGDPSPGHDVRRFPVNADGTLGSPAIHFNEAWGRLRAAVSGPGGQLYVTTSNGGSNERVIRIRPAESSVTRIHGPNRYATAAEVSRSPGGYPHGADDVMVATGLNYPDALAGSAAAGHLGMPVLLVTRTGIHDVTRAELDRLKPKRIWVLGSAGVVSESVRTQLEVYASTGQAERLEGANRYGTAAAISAKWFAEDVPAVFIATGLGFADALAGAPAAAMSESPLLLVRPDRIPVETAAELDRLKPQRIYVLGGPSVVSTTVEALLDGYTTGPVTRLAGDDRYETAAAITSTFWTRTDGYVATGWGYADALTGGAVAGHRNQPMLLVKDGVVPLVIGQEILQFGSRQLSILGSTGAVPTSAEKVLKRLVGSP